MEDTAGWLTEEQLIAETGVRPFTLDRRRREGLVPWNRRFLGFEVGSRTVYPPIAVAMVRRVQELQREFKGVDRWRWTLWLEGYPVDIVKWHSDRLIRLKERAEAFAKGNIKTVVVEATGKPIATRRGTGSCARRLPLILPLPAASPARQAKCS
jgi:hypothetical protein